MRKIELPSVKDATWKKEYKPSGKCPGGTRALLFILGPLIGIAAGAAAFYGGSLTSFLADIILKVFIGVGLCGGIFSWVTLALSLVAIVLFLGLGLPALIGFLIGYGIFLIAQIGRCRNPNLTTGIGLLSGSIAYGVFAVLAVRSGGMHETAHLTKLLPGLSITSGWMIFFVILDALILILVAGVSSGTFIQNKPFCEGCQKWYGKPIEALYAVEFYDMGFTRQLIQMLESGAPPQLKKDWRLPAKTRANRIRLSLQRCSCGQADYKLTTTLHWQETRTEKGQHYYSKDKLVVEDKSEEWFTTMVSPGLGRQIEQALFAPLVPAE